MVSSTKKQNQSSYFWTVFISILLVVISYKRPEHKLDLDRVEQMVSDYMKKTPYGKQLLKKQTKTQRYKYPSEEKWNSHPLKGVKIVITGATSGIGLSITKNVHGLGATVIAVGRSSHKLKRLQTQLEKNNEKENKGANDSRLIPIIADLSDLNSVSNAANEISKQVKSIDILVNNAGMHYNLNVMNPFAATLSTKQGHDLVFGVNYLSHFLLTAKMLPLLDKSKLTPRIVQISSIYHWMVDGSDLIAGENNTDIDLPIASQSNKQSFTQKNRSYANSKLAQIYHARALARRLKKEKSSISVVSICPSWVKTNIGGAGMKYLDYMGAFDVEEVGISSSLNGMFLSNIGGEGADFISQTEVNLDIFPQKPDWLVKFLKWLNIKDHVSLLAGMIILYFQRFFFKEIAIADSSIESYDVDKQESLYKWSVREISPWL